MVALARAHGLTAYDAAYLELALRTGLPLATLDTRLGSAARVAGIKLVGDDLTLGKATRRSSQETLKSAL